MAVTASDIIEAVRAATPEEIASLNRLLTILKPHEPSPDGRGPWVSPEDDRLFLDAMREECKNRDEIDKPSDDPSGIIAG